MHDCGCSLTIADMIGQTPIVMLRRSVPSSVRARIMCKCEFMNPTGSVKDRIALFMIREAERKGKLRPGMTIIVPTTGNTGISFAAIAGALGYKVLVVLPEEVSTERFMLLKLYGADVIKTKGGGQNAMEALEQAYRIAEKDPDKYYVADQWRDEANIMAHYETTATEILEQAGEVNAFVAGVGTGGTLIGVAKRLKEKNSDVLIIAVEPVECPVINSRLKGEKLVCRSHSIEGIGDGFLPPIVEENLDLIDEVVLVTSAEAIETAKKLARMEGLAVGISAGANVAASIKVAVNHEFSEKDTIVTVLPDAASRYYSVLLKNTNQQ